MRVLVDTPVWSLALRRRRSQLTTGERALVMNLEDLIASGAAVLVGPVCQELLTGIRDVSTFEKLRRHLAHFVEAPINTAEYEEAARCANLCRRNGIAGSPTDYLLCAVALIRQLAVLTTDRDFDHFERWLKIRRFRP